MDSGLFIKIDFKKDRPNPSQLFEAMSLYIIGYEQLGQTLAKSIDVKQEFKFQLENVEFSSIKARLSQACHFLDQFFINRVSNAGAKLFNEFMDVEETSSEEQVDKLAADLEETFITDGLGNEFDAHIDRKLLSQALDTFSRANKLIQNGEIVEFGNGITSQLFNTNWRFTGDLSTMFLGEKETVTATDYLYVKIAINEGKQLWTFRSARMNKTFTARILVQDWLVNYQSGYIPPIGPKDTLLATFRYDLYKPYDKRKNSEIRNVKILSIDNIVRGGSEEQYEIPA